jgi:hypothetical protein
MAVFRSERDVAFTSLGGDIMIRCLPFSTRKVNMVKRGVLEARARR